MARHFLNARLVCVGKARTVARAVKIVLAAALLTIGLNPHHAFAAWSGWEDLGGQIRSAPACSSWGANRIDCFARGTNDAL